MRIAIPISFHDQQDIPRLIDILLKFGGLYRHHVTFFPQLSQTQVAKEACARILPHCANSTVVAMSYDLPTNNVPQSPNVQFAFVAKQIAQMPDHLPWLWMEADALPTKENWADKLEQQYIQSRKLFMGNIVPTPYRSEQGVWFTVAGDEMMMGVGVYPHQMALMYEHPSIAGRIDELVLGQNGAPWTWGVYLRQTMQFMGWANTTLISDQNGTGNYRMVGDDLMCDPVPCDPPRRERGGQIHREAVLVHGCKDGTLERIILGESEKPVVADPVVYDEQDKSIGVAGALGPDDSGLNGIPDYGVGDDPGPDGPVGPPGFDAKELRRRIKKKATRLGEIAKEWNVDLASARKMLEDAGFSISGPGWIKAK